MEDSFRGRDDFATGRRKKRPIRCREMTYPLMSQSIVFRPFDDGNLARSKDALAGQGWSRDPMSYRRDPVNGTATSLPKLDNTVASSSQLQWRSLGGGGGRMMEERRPYMLAGRSVKLDAIPASNHARVFLPESMLTQTNSVRGNDFFAGDSGVVGSSPNHSVCFEADDPDVITDSMTLPRIEEVLRSEGVQPQSISQQIERLKMKNTREHVQNDANSENISPRRRLPVAAKLRDELSNQNSGSTGLLKVPNSRNSQVFQSNYPRPVKSDKGSPRLVPPPNTSRTTARTSYQNGPVSNLDFAMKREEETLNSYRDDIERTRWLTAQHLEKISTAHNFIPPRILLLASNLSTCSMLRRAARRKPEVLVIVYEFKTATYDSILDDIKNSLNSYKQGCMARSIMLACTGGPGHLYMLKKRVVTVPRLRKEQESDLARFWKEISESCISRIDTDQAFFHILNPDVLGMQTRHNDADLYKVLQFLEEMEKFVLPNIVHFCLPDDTTHEGKETVGLYLEYADYMGLLAADMMVTDADDMQLSADPHTPTSSTPRDIAVVDEIFAHNQPPARTENETEEPQIP